MPDNPIDRLYTAITTGDAAAVRACLTPDALLWHSFDGIAQDVETAVAGFEQLFAHTTERCPHDIHREPIVDGFLQQHVFVATSAAGGRKAWPCCLVVRIEGNRIARIDEYIDRVGSFSPADGPVTMPGW